jgi:hypothetical protein
MRRKGRESKEIRRKGEKKDEELKGKEDKRKEKGTVPRNWYKRKGVNHSRRN